MDCLCIGHLLDLEDAENQETGELPAPPVAALVSVTASGG